ncbi:MAG: hypothetical protein ACI4D4_10995 [Lachnospira sp.]
MEKEKGGKRIMLLFHRNVKSKEYIENYSNMSVVDRLTYEYTYFETFKLYADAYPAWEKLSEKDRDEFTGFKDFQKQVRMLAVGDVIGAVIGVFICYGLYVLLGRFGLF